MLDEYVGEIRNDLPTKMRSGPSQPTRHRRRCRPKSRQRSSRDWRVVALIVLIASSFGSESAQGFEGNRGHRPSTRNIDDSSLRGEEGRQQRKNRTNDSAISGSAPHDDSFPVPRRTLRILRHRVVRRSVNIVEGVRTRSTNSQSGGSAFVHPWSCRTIRGGALQPPNVVDRLARSWALFLAWVVSFQTLRSAVRYHKEFLLELATRFMSTESIKAARTIQRILASVEDHGVIDVFSKYPTQELLASIYALSRLQAVSQAYDRQRYYDGKIVNDEKLLEALAYYAPFASAAYGWTLDLATGGRLHFGDLQALIRSTSIRPEDVVMFNTESQANRPACFVVRDRKRNNLVVGIRGTWSANDVLCDLCCTSEEYRVSPNRNSSRRHLNRRTKYKAHHGMLEAARGVDDLLRDAVAKELEADPSLSLVLVGHSLGGSVAAVLASLWEDTFDDIIVYAYGGACVAPPDDLTHLDNGGKTSVRVVTVINEGDPFPSLSLGHVADVSVALSVLCENPELRNTILIHTDGRIKDIDQRDSKWCSETMKELRKSMTGEKSYPPGRLLFLCSDPKGDSQDNETDDSKSHVREVTHDFFHDLVIGPRMFDLSRHVPRLYHRRLCESLARVRSDRTEEL